MFYRVTATASWWRHSHEGLPNPDDQDNPELAEFLEALERHYTKHLDKISKNTGVPVDQMIVARDCPLATIWRRQHYEGYKAKRLESDKGVSTYGPYIKHLNGKYLDKFRCVLRVDQAEADDIIGTLVRYYKFTQPETPLIIIANDSDYNQLMRYDGIRIYNPKGDKWVECDDPADALAEKIRRGDSSDEIPAGLPTHLKRLLIDLSCVPRNVQDKVMSAYQIATGEWAGHMFSPMPIQLGLCCINTELQKQKIICSRSMILNTIAKQGLEELQARARLNCRDLMTHLKDNARRGIRVFRMSSDLFPHMNNAKAEFILHWRDRIGPDWRCEWDNDRIIFTRMTAGDPPNVDPDLITDPTPDHEPTDVGYQFVIHYSSEGLGRRRYTLQFAEDALREAGQYARDTGQRLTFHPGQYNVVGTPDDDKFQKTIDELDWHAEVFDLMGCGVDSVMVVHAGGMYGNKPETKKRWAKNFTRLPERVQRRLVLENCEKSFSVVDCLDVSRECGVPVVLDTHHFDCYAKSHPTEHFDDISTYIPAVLETWGARKPKMHVSEQAEGKKLGAHSDLISEIPSALLDIPKLYGVSVDVMIEAKLKEQAVEGLYPIHPCLDPHVEHRDRVRDKDKPRVKAIAKPRVKAIAKSRIKIRVRVRVRAHAPAVD